MTEIDKLLDKDKVSRAWKTKNGMPGMEFTDNDSGNTLFLPAVGCRDYKDGALSSVNLYCKYWTGARNGSREANMLSSCTDHTGTRDITDWYCVLRFCAFSVRPVAVVND
jgi:hypothetical protein